MVVDKEVVVGWLVTWASVLITHISTPRSKLVDPLGDVCIVRKTNIDGE